MDGLTTWRQDRDLGGARVLVVEDDFFVSLELQTVLEDAGAEVVGVCRSVEEALAAIDADGLAAAILDFRLGKQNVRPVARRLARRGTPFVFYTGQTEEASALLAEWPRSRFVAKPAPARSVIATIADMIRDAPPQPHAGSPAARG